MDKNKEWIDKSYFIRINWYKYRKMIKIINNYNIN
jgi:hypothetical protein